MHSASNIFDFLMSGGLFYPLPDFLVKKLQRLQFAAVSYVTGRDVRDINDVLKIGWLRMKETRDFLFLFSRLYHLISRSMKLSIHVCCTRNVYNKILHQRMAAFKIVLHSFSISLPVHMCSSVLRNDFFFIPKL